MSVLLHSLTVITLCLIAWQDFRSRAVTWILFPLLAICGAALAFVALGSMSEVGRNIMINWGFLVLQLAVVKTWFFLRGKGKAPFIDHAIGKGDMLFLLAFGCFFSPINFILFYLLSLLFALTLYLAVRLWPGFPSRFSTIPLAGLQAAFLLLCLPMHLLLNIPLTNDDWITMKLV